MTERVDLLSELFDDKTVKVLKKLLLKKDTFYLRDISRETGVSLATTFRIVQRLMGMGLVKKQQQGKFTIYSLNRDAPIFLDVYKLIIGEALDAVGLVKKALKGSYDISRTNLFVLKDNKNKIFIISDDVEPAFVSGLATTIKEELGTKVDLMAISHSQFRQMREMKLISAGKHAEIN